MVLKLQDYNQNFLAGIIALKKLANFSEATMQKEIRHYLKGKICVLKIGPRNIHKRSYPRILRRNHQKIM